MEGLEGLVVALGVALPRHHRTEALEIRLQHHRLKEVLEEMVINPLLFMALAVVVGHLLSEQMVQGAPVVTVEQVRRQLFLVFL